MHLAAGALPGPLEELEHSATPPDPLAAIGGRDLLLRGRGGEGRKKGREKGGGGREKEGEGKWRGLPPLYLTSGYGPGCDAVYVSGPKTFSSLLRCKAICMLLT